MVFWQLGVLKGLSKHMDTSALPMLGSSSGAMVTTFAACGVAPDRAVEEMVALLSRQQICQRQLGLVGVLGGITRSWLERCLPPDAGALCSRRSTVLVTRLPLLRTSHITQFGSKQDVVDVVMASAHLPLVLDWTWYALCRQHAVIDGGFWWWWSRCEQEYRHAGGAPPPTLPYSTPSLAAASAAQAPGPAAPPPPPPLGWLLAGGQHGPMPAGGAGAPRPFHPSSASASASSAPAAPARAVLVQPADDPALLADWRRYRRWRPDDLAAARDMLGRGEEYGAGPLLARLAAEAEAAAAAEQGRAAFAGGGGGGLLLPGA